MTGIASSTIPSGLDLPSAKLDATFRRLMAFRRRVPLPFSIWSRRVSASTSVSMSDSRRLIDSAPMPPSKKSPNRSRSDR